ncbi:archease [Halobellus rufus]|uniref:archease n=1 Tax=Halobellus rufus TaxID=1448860 RepID=UPI000678F25B|nr:archease [Halobellus rufus]
MSFTLREHTADVAVEANAPDLSALFGEVGNGLAAASCDDVPDTLPDTAEPFEVDVAAESLQALLFDYLDQLIYERDVRSVLPVENRVTVARGDADATAEWHLSGTARGLPLADVDAREVKAVTYSEMRVEETDDGWTAYVVLDV